jgi:conjugal transfer pilus assembly protein TraE
MDFTGQPHRLRRFATRLNLMIVLVVGLLLSNLLTGALAWYSTLHQKIEITPFSGAATYQKSMLSIDSHYLSMMTENFIYSRLNFTPETVRLGHKRLLESVDIKYYPKALEMLNKESRMVSSKKISSYFEIQNMQCDEKKRRCTVTGKLKQATKSRAFRETSASYDVQYQYHLGRLVITQFTREDKSE